MLHVKDPSKVNNLPHTHTSTSASLFSALNILKIIWSKYDEIISRSSKASDHVTHFKNKSKPIRNTKQQNALKSQVWMHPRGICDGICETTSGAGLGRRVTTSNTSVNASDFPRHTQQGAGYGDIWLISDCPKLLSIRKQCCGLFVALGSSAIRITLALFSCKCPHMVTSWPQMYSNRNTFSSINK